MNHYTTRQTVDLHALMWQNNHTINVLIQYIVGLRQSSLFYTLHHLTICSKTMNYPFKIHITHSIIHCIISHRNYALISICTHSILYCEALIMTSDIYLFSLSHLYLIICAVTEEVIESESQDGVVTGGESCKLSINRQRRFCVKMACW